MTNSGKILIYGYGNPGRQDDGLGAAFIQKVDDFIIQNNLDHIFTDCNYQLNIEDADTVSKATAVVFVDASQEENIEHFSLSEVDASDARVEFSMHAVSPSFVIDLCRKIYGVSPIAWLIHIKGYEWDFKEEMSEKAKENLEMAFDFFKPFLLTKQPSDLINALTTEN